jgi:CBS domain-containing protein
MKVEQVMTVSPATCGLDETLGQAIERMWDADCGIIPVVDAKGRVILVITDRDIAMASATRGLAPGDIRAREMQHKPVISCRPEDGVLHALNLMRTHRVRRLPVTTAEGVLHGIISIDDIAQCATPGGSVTAADVLGALQSVSAPFGVKASPALDAIARDGG